MPQVPHQLFVMRYLTAHLEATSGSWEDGTPIDLVGEVYRGRKFYSDEDFAASGADAMLSILEAPRPLIGDRGGVEKRQRNENWTLLLQGWTKDDKKNPSDPAYFLKSAVEVQLNKLFAKDGQGEPAFPSVYLMGGIITDFIVGQGLVRPPEAAITRFTMFYIPLVIALVTDTGNPYVLTN